MNRNSIKVHQHALDRLAARCGFYVSFKEMNVLVQKGLELFTSSDGSTYLLLPVHNRLPVLVVKNDVGATAVNIAMAFEDCPAAVFYALIQIGAVQPALALRVNRKTKSLVGRYPDAKYNHRTAHIVWNAFRYLEAPK